MALSKLHFLAPAETPIIEFNGKEHVVYVTRTGNKISKATTLCGLEQFTVVGKTIIEKGVVFRGDLAKISIGMYTIICRDAVIRPGLQPYTEKVGYIPLSIGNHTVIEEGSIVEAASVGSYVHIGKNCVIGQRCIISDCAVITDDPVLAPGTVVPPFTIFSGNPAKYVERLPIAFADECKDHTMAFYNNF
eukprot:428138_1